MMARWALLFLACFEFLGAAGPGRPLYDDPVLKHHAKLTLIPLEELAPLSALYQELPPRWITELTVPIASQDNGADVQILLIDKQVNLDAETTYYHIAKKVLSVEGIRQHALIEFPFDPSFQAISIHKICRHRHGKVFDLACRNDFHLMPDPTKAKNWSLMVLIDELFEGDVIEYSYSTKGRNPADFGRVVEECFFQYSHPVERIYFRVLGSDASRIYSKGHNATLEPVKHSLEGDGWECVWNAVNVPACHHESEVPLWYEDYSWVQVSDFENWVDVSRWGRGLFHLPKQLPSNIQELCQQWESQYTTPEQQALAALRFVQDDIALIAEDPLELLIPASLTTIIGGRVATSTDKAYALTALLKGMNIHAIPAAVSKKYKQVVGNWHPSPAPFDHLIVNVKIGEQSFWVDPSASHEGGSLDQGECANYQRALLLDGMSRELTCLGHVDSHPDIATTSTYFAWPDKLETSLWVETVIHGSAANELRRVLSQQGTQSTRERLISELTSLHGQVTVVSPTTISDNRMTNEILIKEHYRINNLWNLSEHGRFKEFATRALQTVSHLPSFSVESRKTPLALNSRTHIVETIHVITPGHEWDIAKAHEHIRSSMMDCSVSHFGKGDTLTLHSELQVLSDYVFPNEMQSLQNAVEQTKQALNLEAKLPTGYNKPWDITFPFVVNAYLLLAIALLAIDRRRLKPIVQSV